LFTAPRVFQGVNLSGPNFDFANQARAVTYTVTYTDPSIQAVSLSAKDVTLSATGNATANVTVDGSGDTWHVVLNGIQGDGTLGISIAAGTATNANGDPAPAVGPSQTFIADNTLPAVTIGGPSVSTTKAGPVSFSVSVADAYLTAPVTLTPSDVTIVSPNTHMAGTIGVSQIDAAHFTVTVSDLRGGPGLLAIKLPDGLVSDLAGNLSVAQTSASAQVTGARKFRLQLSTPPTFVRPGSSYTYLIAYRNIGTETSTDAALLVNLPADAAIVVGGSTGGWTLIGPGQYRLALGDVGPNAFGRVRFQVTFQSPSVTTREQFIVSLTDDLTPDVPLPRRVGYSTLFRSRLV
jgi:hypothetical protein